MHVQPRTYPPCVPRASTNGPADIGRIVRRLGNLAVLVGRRHVALVEHAPLIVGGCGHAALVERDGSHAPLVVCRLGIGGLVDELDSLHWNSSTESHGGAAVEANEGSMQARSRGGRSSARPIYDVMRRCKGHMKGRAGRSAQFTDCDARIRRGRTAI